MRKAIEFLSFIVVSASTLTHPSVVTSSKDVNAICKVIR